MLPFAKEDYMKEVEAGYVKRRVHYEDPNVVILNYTDLCVYERRWNDVTLACRGLIINEETGEVLARPFPKFFNHGEIRGIQPIPQDEVPVITNKIDGSLGILYRLNGKVRWATRGSFVSEQAKEAQRIWDMKYSHLDSNQGLGDGVTLLAEIVTPNTRVVIDYKGMDDLVLLGAINRLTGDEFPYSLVEFISKNHWHIPMTERVHGDLQELIVKAEYELTQNEEGYVFHWEDNKLRLKVKSSKYIDVHRIMYGMSDKRKFTNWANGVMKEYISSIPEEFREELEVFEKDLDEKVKEILDFIELHYNMSPKESSKDVSTYATIVFVEMLGKRHLATLFLDRFYGRDVEKKIKTLVAKNYINIMNGEMLK